MLLGEQLSPRLLLLINPRGGAERDCCSRGKGKQRTTASPEILLIFKLSSSVCGEVNKPSSHHLAGDGLQQRARKSMDHSRLSVCACVCVYSAKDQFSYSLLPFARLSVCLFALSGVRRAGAHVLRIFVH